MTTVRSPRAAGPLAAALLAAALGCAGPRAAGSAASGGARPVEALVVRNDLSAAQRGVSRALARRGRDPWAHLGAALLARRALDAAGEVRHLVAIAADAPAHPLALVALRRLSELAEESPARAGEIEAGRGMLVVFK